MEPFHPVVAQITTLLIERGCWFERFEHEPVRTSEEAAKVRPEYSLEQGTKTLIVRARRPNEEKRFVMIVVPGDKQFDPKKLKAATGYSDVRFATPEEVGKITEGIIPGGVPPWGQLFGLQIFADRQVFGNEKIIFNAGDRRVSVGMFSGDYLAIVTPSVVDIVKSDT